MNRQPGGFASLNCTQFLGALNDNVFKLLAVFALIHALGESNATRITTTGGAFFVLPFLIFSIWAGKLADAFSKQQIILCTKWSELFLMLLGVAAIWSCSALLLYATIFLMSSQSAFFGPAKFGILPELVGSKNIPLANGRMQATMMLAAISGMLLAPLFVMLGHGKYELAAVGCVLISACGVAAAMKIPNHSADNAEHRRPRIRTVIACFREEVSLIYTLFAAVIFYYSAALIQLNIIPYGMTAFGFTQERASLLFLPTAAGIAAGSLIAGRVSKSEREMSLVSPGAFVMAMSIGALMLPLTLAGALVFLFFGGFGAGLYQVPLAGWLQRRAPNHIRASVIAFSNTANWIGILLSSIALALAAQFLVPRLCFLLAALPVLLAAIFTLSIKSIFEKSKRY